MQPLSSCAEEASHQLVVSATHMPKHDFWVQAEEALLGLRKQVPCSFESEHWGRDESEAPAAQKGRSGGSGDGRQLEHAAVRGQDEPRLASKVRSDCAAHARCKRLVLPCEHAGVMSTKLLLSQGPSWITTKVFKYSA